MRCGREEEGGARQLPARRGFPIYWGSMTVGAGFALDAIRRARQFEKEMARRPRVRVRAPRGSEGAEVEAFECHQVCGACGLLGDVPSADPYRAEQTAGVAAPVCPSCGAQAWIDLRNIAAALALRDMEERARQEPPGWVRSKTRMVEGAFGMSAAGSAALALQLLLAPALGPLVVVSAATGGLTALLTNQLFARPLSRLLLARKPVGPARWRRALPIPDVRSPVVALRRGRARGRGDTLKAPISGRPCLAYEVGVVFDADGDAYPPMWVLREDRSRAFGVDGVEIESDRVALELPLEDVSAAADAQPPTELVMFLRKRGLFHSDGAFEFFESVLIEGAPVELVRHAVPEGAPWVVRSVEESAPTSG